MSPVMTLSAVCYLVLLFVTIRQMRICRGRGEPIALFVLAVHGMVYFAVYLVLKLSTGIDALFWNTWSSALRLQSIFTVAAIELLRWRRLENSSGCE